VSGLSLDVLFDYLAIRLDAAKAARLHWRLDWVISDTGERVALNLENSTLTCILGKQSVSPDATVTVTRKALEAIALRPQALAGTLADGTCQVAGESAKLTALFAMLDDFTLMFEIVTPGAARHISASNN
jgi:alkyl sulfatase BDS1-like metallo-beta-lactamase superfamily hydrolase